MSMSESEFVDDVDAIDVDEENGNNFPGNGEEDAMEEEEEEKNSDSEEEQDTEESYLKMPEQKLKDPAPVWKCAVRVPNGAKCSICGEVYKTAILLGSPGTSRRSMQKSPK